MKLLNQVTKVFGLNEKTWIKHSNPWSVWTRFIILPFLAFSIWSRIWIEWYSLLPIVIILLWTWLNPRFFAKPKTTKHWSSKAVFGERVWLQKKKLDIPKHHIRAIAILNAVTGLGLPFLIWGLYALHFWAVLLGLVIVILGKMWFLDRMVWLYEDIKKHSEEYLSWEY